MISRYEIKDISNIWEESSRFNKLLSVEKALLGSLEEKSIIPKGTTSAFDSVKINVDRIHEIEKVTRHDVIAFCTSITEQVGPEYARFFHFGVTSSDILDTALTLQIRESLDIIRKDLANLKTTISKKISETKDLLCLGRSHGMNAEPMVFAQKFFSFHQEIQRRLNELDAILKTEMTGQISGAVGNYSVLSPDIENIVLKKLDLLVEPVSTQVIPRDRIAKIISWGALTATTIERFSVEIRHLHHSDIGEVHEGFVSGQKGSSTMPHKKNPIASENITGLARVIRSHVDIALDNVVLWHERDISHSSTERLYLPDHFGLVTYILRRMSTTIDLLEIHRETIEQKVKSNFTSFTSLILHELILKNLSDRESLYSVVQDVSFRAQSMEEFFSLLKMSLTQAGLHGDFSQINYESLRKKYLENFEIILKRSGN